MLYSEELASEYADKRKSYDATDGSFFGTLESIGVKDKVVLDIGCGDGRMDLEIKKMGATRVLGIDTSAKMIEIAQGFSTDPDVTFQVADAIQLPVADKSTDIVVSNFCIHYFADTTPVFREISRVLKNDGRYAGIFCITDAAEGYEHLYNTEIPVRLGQSVLVHCLVKARKDIEASVAAAGLSILKYQEVEDNSSVIDDAYPDKDKLRKAAVLMVLEKKV